MALQVYRQIFCRKVVKNMALEERATLMTMSVPLMLSVRKRSSSFADQLPIVALSFKQSNNRLDKTSKGTAPELDTLPSLRR